MKIVTYLGFTLFSIFIQFSVMDYIQEKLQFDEKLTDISNGTSQKRQLRDILKDITYNKSHALYYQTQMSKIHKSDAPAKQPSNTTITELLATTDITTKEFEVLYDENTTDSEEPYTTETIYTSTEIDNVTEITLFEKSNKTDVKPKEMPKKVANEDCNCNFLYKVCDMNCCCDSDCSDIELKLFPNCIKNRSIATVDTNDACYADLPYFGQGNVLFCIVKINLPDKSSFVPHKISQPSNNLLTWKNTASPRTLYEFSNEVYKYGDPVWLLKNRSFYYIDLPSPSINSYCTGRRPIRFLKDEKFSCNVKIRDLEMFQIAKSSEETTVISSTPTSMNSSILNCSTLHCANWTIIACCNLVCTNYSENKHEPNCTERTCTNLALKVDYIFYYHESKIINASIKYHVQNISTDLPFIKQEIQVQFVLANQSIDRIVKLSGSPGYLDGLPIIVSYAEKNHTEMFYNNTVKTNKYFHVPENRNGACISSNISNNVILFGRNRRIKCRYSHSYLKLRNFTDECKNIQNNIHMLLELNSVIISPLGNPQGLIDTYWIPMEKVTSVEAPLYAHVQDKTSKLYCFNIITRYTIIFSYAIVNGHNRILATKYEFSGKNASFSLEDISTVVTFDISFIFVTKPRAYEYTEGPNLNIHFPEDFFYPFRSNESYVLKCDLLTLFIYCYITMIACK